MTLCWCRAVCDDLWWSLMIGGDWLWLRTVGDDDDICWWWWLLMIDEDCSRVVMICDVLNLLLIIGVVDWLWLVDYASLYDDEDMMIDVDSIMVDDDWLGFVVLLMTCDNLRRWVVTTDWWVMFVIMIMTYDDDWLRTTVDWWLMIMMTDDYCCGWCLWGLVLADFMMNAYMWRAMMLRSALRCLLQMIDGRCRLLMIVFWFLIIWD